MADKDIIIRNTEGITKIRALTGAIREAVSSGQFLPGDPLPSINALCRSTGFSRDTVVKAYNILRQESVIGSTPAKGFYVAGGAQRVFMLLDDFSAFKEQLYRAFRDNLPGNFSVDLLFHHYNEEVFEHLVRQASGRYSAYIVMNISNTSEHPVLALLDAGRLLVLDMGGGPDSKYNHLLQNFDTAVLDSIHPERERFRKYRQMVYVYSRMKTPHPPETEQAMRTFCSQNGLDFHKIEEVHHECMVPGQVYVVFTESDLVEVLKGCRISGLSLGSEVGILAYNDTPMKEFTGNGISVLSVDFSEMGRKAAAFVTTRHKVREVLPTRLILRNSL